MKISTVPSLYYFLILSTEDKTKTRAVNISVWFSQNEGNLELLPFSIH